MDMIVLILIGLVIGVILVGLHYYYVYKPSKEFKERQERLRRMI